MAFFYTLRPWLARRAENVLALLQFSLFISFLLQIIFRYFLHLPVGWTVEWVAIAWLWAILFGYAFVVSDSETIRLDVLYSVLPPKYQRLSDFVTGLIVAAIFAWTLPVCWEYINFMKVERTAYLRIPFNLVFSIYIPFALAVIVRSLLSVHTAILGSGRYAKPAPTAGGHYNV